MFVLYACFMCFGIQVAPLFKLLNKNNVAYSGKYTTLPCQACCYSGQRCDLYSLLANYNINEFTDSLFTFYESAKYRFILHKLLNKSDS